MKTLKKYWFETLMFTFFVILVSVTVTKEVLDYRYYRTVKDNLSCEEISAGTEKCVLNDDVFCFIKTKHTVDFLGTSRENREISCDFGEKTSVSK